MPETQQPEKQQPILLWMILLLGLIIVGLCLLSIQQEPSTVPLDTWVVEARRALRAGQATPPIPPGVAEKQALIATSIPLPFMGVNNREILRCANVIPGSGSSLNLGFPQVEQSALVFLSSSTGPLVMNPPSGLSLPEFAVPKNLALEARTFLASVNCGLTQPIPQLASETFLKYLSITPGTPTFVMNPEAGESAKVLGPLFQSGKLPLEPGIKLPDGFLVLPPGGTGLPEAYGVFFESLKMVPPPLIDWERGFQARLASSPNLVTYAKIWHSRQALLATWVPQLCDNVAFLLRSGPLAFNRPDVLTASASLLSPMDEIQILRALFHVGCYSSYQRWYPRPMASAPNVIDPFDAIPECVMQTFSSPDELLKALSSNADQSFDRFFLLEKGDLTLDSVTSSHTLWIGCLGGNITLKGNFNAQTMFVATKGGNIIVSGGRTPSLVAMATQAPDGTLQGGRIIINGPTIFSGNVRCQTFEFAEKSGESKFSPTFFPLESQLFLVTKPSGKR